MRARVRTAAVVTAAAVALVFAAGVSAAPGSAAAPAAVPAASTSVEDERLRLRTRFAREVTKRGDRDRGVHSIEHVRELQFRLRWANVYSGPASGRYRSWTANAVKRFQRKADLRVTGKATAKTWAELIKRTTRGERAMPYRCRNGIGWHACYDRGRHQVALYHRGNLWNSWLVRGGSASHKTRVGNWRVFRRDRHHTSSLYGSPMPWSQFFSGGQAFHGSSKMMNPFVGHSHGCVNMYNEDARQLWALTHRVNLNVHVYGPWS